jgi:thiol-disulfide isomerase/thioredoxin
VTVHYRPGANGWGETFGGQPVKVWDDAAPVATLYRSPVAAARPAAPASAPTPAAESAMAGLFGTELHNAAGEKVSVDKLDGKLVGIYFSAHWCLPCRAFTPKLVEFHRSVTAAGKPFEIVFVSSDQDEAAMAAYMTGSAMPWLAVPFGAPKVKDLKEKYKVRGIPTLVVVNAKGETISAKARGAVTQADAAAFDEWAKE